MPPWLQGILSGSLVAGVLAYFSNRASNRTALRVARMEADRDQDKLDAESAEGGRKASVEQFRVDGEALERARVITDGVITTLQEELSRYAKDLQKARAEVDRLTSQLEERELLNLRREQLRVELERKLDQVLRRDDLLVKALRRLLEAMRSHSVPAAITAELERILADFREAAEQLSD